jgi:ATP-dependent protease ClpP protease subunit
MSSLVIFLPNLCLIISLLVTDRILVMQYRERVIFIGQHIDEEFSNQILATMLYLDSVDNSKKLYMYINGPGGDVSSL